MTERPTPPLDLPRFILLVGGKPVDQRLLSNAICMESLQRLPESLEERLITAALTLFTNDGGMFRDLPEGVSEMDVKLGVGWTVVEAVAHLRSWIHDKLGPRVLANLCIGGLDFDMVMEFVILDVKTPKEVDTFIGEFGEDDVLTLLHRDLPGGMAWPPALYWNSVDDAMTTLRDVSNSRRLRAHTEGSAA